MSDESKTGVNKAGAEEELTKKKAEKKTPIDIKTVPNDADLQSHITLEEENEKLKDANKTLKVEKEMLQKMLRVSQQQNLELIEGMENVKADFENGRMR